VVLQLARRGRSTQTPRPRSVTVPA
jgi:hypothetical protein